MLRTLLQAHLLQPTLRRLRGCLPVFTPNPQGHGHVVQGAEFGQQVVKLVDKTQAAIAPEPLL